MHISTAIKQYGKTATVLAMAELHTDQYHQNIKESAQAMVDQGNGNWVYETQYTSGNCRWGSPDNKLGMVIELN